MSKKLSELTDVEWPVKRRTFLAALGTGAAGGAAALGDGSKQLASIGGVDTGDITSEYRADEEWYGPDSTKGNVSPNTGRKFVALDTGIEYFGDGTTWVDREAYQAKVISTDRLFSKSVTMYVRSSGSDSNDGLTSGNAKATINSAISDAPLQGTYADHLTIDVGDGTFTDDDIPIRLREQSIDKVEIIGNTDGSNNPTSIIDADTQTYGLSTRGPLRVTLQNLEIKNAEGWNLDIKDSVVCELSNCRIKDGVQRNAYVQMGCVLIDDSDTVFSLADGTVGSFGNIESTGNCTTQLAGTYDGEGGDDRVIRAKQDGWLFVKGSATVRGTDTGSTWCVYTDDEIDLKVDGGATFEDAYGALRSGRGGNVKISNGTVTLNNVTHKFRNESGSQRQDSNGDRVFSLPFNPGTPTEWGGQPFYDGDVYFDRSRDYPVVYSDSRGDLEFGRTLLKEGSLVVPSGGSVRESTTLGADGCVQVVYGVAASPGIDTEVEWSLYWDNSAGVQQVKFSELSGSSDVTVNYQFYNIDR